MIGKGAQYLTAAGFGRYRITAASLGSNLMFGALWLKDATRQAIMDAFGVDGTAVIAATNEYLNGIAASDKAKATALAGFINEDPMMVCSLGLQVQGVTMPIRWLVGDGVAYINTGLVPTSAMNYRLVGKNSNMASGSFAGSRNVGFGGIIFGMKVIDYFPTNPSSSTRWTFDQATAWSRMEYVIKEGVAKVYTNDVLLGEHTFTNTEGTTTRTLHLYEINNDGSHGTYAVGMSIALVEIENLSEMYPFIRKISGVSKLGMLDVLNDTFYQNIGSGSFSIEYCLPDGTPWTPPTP
jgi:hypothetical protein